MSESNQNISSNSKRIVKNTLLLYVRMLLMMIIGLYTSRVILNALGVEDYGIYSVVGGVVSMFSIISGSLSAAISRFIVFELGRGDKDKLHRIFCTSVNVQIALIVIITLLLETVGFWFLNNKMIIPTDRLIAANWVFQFSIFAFALNLLCVPYISTIIAHEKMSAFAYIGLFDAIARLVISFVILLNPFDRLVYYGLLVLCVGLIQRIMYTIYCKRHFEECFYKPVFDKEITKEMFGFASWNFIGAASVVLRDQGGNMIINIFFGPAVNAARGIAMSVNSAINSFVTNFQMALNPQITKNYASGNHEYMFKLIFQGARFSFYILLLLSLPIMFTAPYILELWLGTVPEHAANFAILVLVFTMSESLASPLITVMLATGNIRNYQIVVGGLQFLNLPFSYILLSFGYQPEYIFVVAIVISISCEFARLIMLHKMIGLSIRAFIKNVYFNVLTVALLSSIFPYLTAKQLIIDNLFSFLIIVSVSMFSSLTAIYFIGCSKNDRQIIQAAINKAINRFK